MVDFCLGGQMLRVFLEEEVDFRKDGKGWQKMLCVLTFHLLLHGL